MKTIDSIPTGKIERATKILKVGVKVGVNYLKYYGDKITQTDAAARTNLNNANAEDIYDGLKELKGSALKVAQMLSMEKSILPQAYVDKFSLSQFSVPPLSSPLVIKTFKKYFNQLPNQLFDEFNTEAINAASIGQVHKAKKNGKLLAVKIQYPGVAESISSDLAMVKLIAMKMFNIKGKNSDQYFKEVEDKLLEETDYFLELKQSQDITNACKHIPNLLFPQYYKEYSCKGIITMDWMQGIHLSEFTKKNTSTDAANKIGQALWDFYMYQIHQLKNVQADPHPGNFLVSESDDLIIIDFGCMKQLPLNFYTPYFELIKPENLNNKEYFSSKMLELEIVKDDDTKDEKEFFIQLFHELISLLSLPFRCENFNFSDKHFFDEITELIQKYASNSQLKNMNANRGSKHFIYMNRTFFGLYNLMNDLKSDHIIINNYKKYI